jgi:dienelactone hydrolase
MIPIAHRIAWSGRRRLAVFRLLNTTRGWDASHTPVDDARWALAQLRERLGALPTCLVGHSLGGRAALLAAGDAHSVVALAPWVYPTDVPRGLDGQEILIVHGARDRIASPQRSAALARTLGAGYVCVRDGTHAMLRRRRLFDGLAASFAAATLLGLPRQGPLARLAAGEARVTV